ncbi:MAG: cytochrome c5 family protein [Limnobacter sp.]|nr:cytochrome c5 family protein [Limnobacter sp.]
MSDESFIKTPRQLITVVILAFVVPIAVIMLLVKYVGSTSRLGAGSDSMTADAIEARIRPVAGFELAADTGPGVARSGEEVFKAQCAACHETGVAGAPKLGDNAAWAERIKTGLDALVHSSLNGKGAMAPQGGGQFSDFEITRAVVYMANSAGGSFEEPEPEGEASADAGAAPAGGEAAAAAPAAAAPAAAGAEPDSAAPAPQAAAPAAESPVSEAPAAEAPAASEPATDTAAAAAPVAAASGADGKKVYDATCSICHNAGVAGAPKLGDKAAWEPHVAAGIETLYMNSLNGIRAMPPRGGNASLSDDEVKAAVDYMVAAVK